MWMIRTLSISLALLWGSSVIADDNVVLEKPIDFEVRFGELERQIESSTHRGDLAELTASHQELLTLTEKCYSAGSWRAKTVRLRLSSDKQIAKLDGPSQAKAIKALQRFITGHAFEDEANFSRAIDFYKEAFGLAQEVLGDEINSIECMERIAICHIRLRQYEKALDSAEKCAAKAQRVFGESHAAIATILSISAESQVYLGKTKEGAKCIEECLAIAQNNDLEESLGYGRMLLILAIAENRLGRHDSAISRSQQASAIYAMERPLNFVSLLRCQAELAKGYSFTGKHEQCIKVTDRIRSLMQLHRIDFPSRDMEELMVRYQVSLIADGQKEKANAISKDFDLGQK